MAAQATPKGAWKITFLLFLFMLVNFADKIVVGLAGVPIMTELKLEPESFGLLGSSFFFLFSIAAIVVGFIVNRVATRWVLLVLAVDLGAGAVSDGRHRQFHHAADLPHHPRRRRGAGVLGRGACRLQMVSGREAHAADRDPVAGLGVRRDPRGAGAELADRQLQLAPCVRRARRRRPDVGRGVADPRQGGPAGADRGAGRRRAARSLLPASHLAHLHRLRAPRPSAPIGRCRWASPGSRLSSSRGLASRSSRPASSRSCPGCSARSS